MKDLSDIKALLVPLAGWEAEIPNCVKGSCFVSEIDVSQRVPGAWVYLDVTFADCYGKKSPRSKFATCNYYVPDEMPDRDKYIVECFHQSVAELAKLARGEPTAARYISSIIAQDPPRPDIGVALPMKELVRTEGGAL
jgi:hypothetical protein